jgi:aldose 1-epimerase
VLELNHGDVHLVLDPDRGGRMVSLAVGDLRLLRTPEDDPDGLHWGAFVMAPWAGRIRHGRFAFDGVEHQLELNSGEHAIHGTVRGQPWTVEDATTRRARLTCDFGPGWPFPGWVEHVLELHDDHLDFELTLHATEGRMPVSTGWHPWWQRRVGDVDARLELPAASMFVRDSEGIALTQLVPPPPGPWDDCFTDLNGPPTLAWDGVLALQIESDCPCVVVYDQPAAAICVEPQTAPPDALNRDPFVADPDHPLRAAMRWRWR